MKKKKIKNILSNFKHKLLLILCKPITYFALFSVIILFCVYNYIDNNVQLSYNVYNLYNQHFVIKKFPNAPNTQNVSTDSIKPFAYSGKKIIYFKPDSLGRTTGVHLQISKKDLVTQKQAISSKLFPKGYAPYYFDSYVFKPFYLYSKQTLLDYPIISNPNYQNNVYTLPTNIVQGGLFARDNGLKRETYQFVSTDTGDQEDHNYDPNFDWDKFIQKSKHKDIANDYVPKYLNTGKNKLLVSYLGGMVNPYIGQGYAIRDIQDHPNYVQEQLIKKLKQLPDNYHLDLSIQLEYYNKRLIPRSIDYQWTFLTKNANGQVAKQNFKLPLINQNTKNQLSYSQIDVHFPDFYPNDEPVYDDFAKIFDKHEDLLFKGYLPNSKLQDGYSLSNENARETLQNDEDPEDDPAHYAQPAHDGLVPNGTDLTNTPLISAWKIKPLLLYVSVSIVYCICELILLVIFIAFLCFKKTKAYQLIKQKAKSFYVSLNE